MLPRVLSWIRSRQAADVRCVPAEDSKQPQAHGQFRDNAEFRAQIRNLVVDGAAEAAHSLLMQNSLHDDPASRVAEAHACIADIFQDLGEAEQARAAIGKALDCRPDDADLNYRAGVHALFAADPELALDYFRLCRYYDPSHFPACSGEAKALEKLGRGAERARLISDYVERHPERCDAVFELALLEHESGQFERAVALLDRIGEKDAMFPEACNLKGLILGRDLGDIQTAISCFERVLLIRPGWTVALSNLGWMYSEAGDFDKGDEFLEAVLGTIPDDPEARLIRAYINLKHGRFAAGWKYYAARHESKFAIERPYRFPSWSGAPARDDTLLIVAEQGLGDHLMFSSCIRDVADRVGKVYLECHPKLVSLFRRSFPLVDVVENVPLGSDPTWLNSVSKIDWQVAMGDLPGIFRPDVESFPRHQGYLKPNPERIKYWKDRIARLGPGIKLGVSWRGGVSATRRQLRSFSPTVFEPLLAGGGHLISLQYGEVDADLEQMEKAGLKISHWPEALSDYDETAALVCALDSVVSVCTAAIHLCGALGRPAFVLVPRVAEWRYQHSGERLPWYPSLRLVRQAEIGHWEPVVERVVALLRESGLEQTHGPSAAN